MNVDRTTGDCRAKIVLLLDDEPIILMTLQFAIADAGAVPFLARSSEDAIAAINTRQIDAAILDVHLDGGRTCAPVAERLAEKGIPFLLHTGDLQRQGELVMALGADVIQKPASDEELTRAVFNLIR